MFGYGSGGVDVAGMVSVSSGVGGTVTVRLATLRTSTSPGPAPFDDDRIDDCILPNLIKTSTGLGIGRHADFAKPRREHGC